MTAHAVKLTVFCRRAYELYEARGREDGHDFDDWLRAEAEITGTAPKTAMA